MAAGQFITVDRGGSKQVIFIGDKGPGAGSPGGANQAAAGLESTKAGHALVVKSKKKAEEDLAAAKEGEGIKAGNATVVQSGSLPGNPLTPEDSGAVMAGNALVVPSGSKGKPAGWNGYNVTSLIKLAHSYGLDFNQTKQLMGKLGTNPNDGTIKQQLYLAKKGSPGATLLAAHQAEFESHVANVKGVQPAPSVVTKPTAAETTSEKSPVEEWLYKWASGTPDEFNPKAMLANKDVINSFSQYRPNQPIQVYRSHIEGKDSNVLESWTTDKEVAETLSDPENSPHLGTGEKRVVLTRLVHPSEIVVSAPHLPTVMHDFIPSHEVVVANGEAAKKLAEIRGEKLERGQQWSGKWSSISPYAKYVNPETTSASPIASKSAATEPAIPQAKTYQGNIKITSLLGDTKEAEQQILKLAKEQGLKVNSLRDLVSAAIPNHELFSEARVYTQHAAIHVDANGENGAHAYRKLSKGVLKNESFDLDKKMQGKGIGSEFFHQQVLNAEKIGITKIKTTADRTETPGFPKTNGYYTWARLGYDGNIPDSVYAKMSYAQRDALPNNKISSLMATDAGRQYWKENGVTTSMSFDPKAGSSNRLILDKYMAAKAAKSAAAAPEKAIETPPAKSPTAVQKVAGMFGEDKAATPAAKAPVKGAFPSDLSKLTTVKSLGGTTGAKLMQDENGNQFVHKIGKSEGQLREEHAAEQMYHALGVPVPASKLYETPNGPVKLSEHIPNAKELGQLSGQEKYQAMHAAQQHFVADALMANWDAVGLEKDNMLVGPDGTLHRADVGGSLRYRAQGGLKGDKFGSVPNELFTLRDSSVNSSAAQVYEGLTHQNIIDQAKAVLSKRDDLLAATPADLKPIMTARLDNLQKIADAGKIAIDNKASKAGVEAAMKDAAGHQVSSKAAPPAKATASGKGATRENPKQLTKANLPVGTETPHSELSAQNGKFKSGESGAIKDFTGSSYPEIRKVDSEGEKNGYEETHQKLYSAMDKLPKYEGTVYRGMGMKQSQIDQLVNGDKVELNAVSSFSRNPQTAAGFASSNSNYPGGPIKPEDFIHPVLLKINNTFTGRAVEHLSSHPSEKEVLFGKGAKFQVASQYWAKLPGHGKHIFHVIEGHEVPESAPKYHPPTGYTPKE